MSNEMKNSLGDADKTAQLQEQNARVRALLDGKPNNITSVSSLNGEHATYTLQGVRVNNPERGIYITQGKKLLSR